MTDPLNQSYRVQVAATITRQVEITLTGNDLVGLQGDALLRLLNDLATEAFFSQTGYSPSDFGSVQAVGFEAWVDPTDWRIA